jgi:hypothetical protein
MPNLMTLSKIFQRLWLITGLALVLVGGVFVPGAAAQGAQDPTLTVVAPALHVRSGPGLDYPAFDVLKQGDQLPVISHNAANNWWQVQLFYGSTGWVSGGSAYVSTSGDISNVSGVNTDQAKQIIDNSPSTIHHSQLSGVLVFQTSSGGPIYAINPECVSLPGGCGSNLRYLTSGMDPALSPDGQWVAFTRWETSQDGALGNVWIIKVDGTGEQVIHQNLYNPRTPVWSPDGSQLVFSFQNGGRPNYERKCSGQRPPRDAVDIDVKRQGRGDVEYCYTLLPDPHWSLRLLNMSTGQSQDLSGDLYSLSPGWDPNNPQRLIYDGEAGLVNLDLVENRTSALTSDIKDHSPVFSPDGSKIAVSYRQDDHWEIHVMNADGSNRQRLTQTSYIELVQQQLRGEQPHSYNNAAPVWSPDGSQIAFLTNRTGPWEIWLMNSDGSNQRPMFPAGTLAGLPLQYQGVDERVLAWH